MQTVQELFLHELSDMVDAEHRILETLSEQIEESNNQTLRSAFQAHHTQTEGHVERLEQCFELLDEEAEETECAGIKGLSEEHQIMREQQPAPDILDVFNIAAAIKVERYEISAYESLIRLAEQLKQTKVVRLLNQILKEEEQTLKKMIILTAKVKPISLDTHESEPEDSSVEASAEEFGGDQQTPREGRPLRRSAKKSSLRRGRAA
jgi:ferritin-like metal-binding protein YciE